MKNLILIVALLSNALFVAFGQNANVELTMRVSLTSHVESSNCWETGTEDYTGKIWFWTDVDNTQRGGSCRQCSFNGNCSNASITDAYTYASTGSYTIDGRIDAWEDDIGDRCDFNTSWVNDDDCRTQKNLSTWTSLRNFREVAYPSNATYQNYGGSSNQLGDGDHWGQIQATWKYTGSVSPITPTCTAQTISHASGRICSNSVNLTAGTTYVFETTSGPDTYLRLYGTDGYTIVALNDDGGVGTLSLITYTATISGWHYIENSQYTRSALSSNSVLSYSIQPVTLGTVSNLGPINFCDAGGNISAPVTVSGQTGTVVWDWGSSNGVWNNNWVAGTSSGTCCIPKKTSTNDGNADRIRYRVVNGSCTVTSATILINNNYNEAPTSLTSNNLTFCSTPASFTLTASFPSSINMNGSVKFYSGSCGGTLVGTVSPTANSTSATVTITAPTSTTVYYARYEPNTGTGCSNSTCVSVTVTVNTPSVAPTAITGTTTICNGASTTLTMSGGTSGTGASAKWYTGSCGGTLVGSGTSISVSPTSTTTYYVRYEGTCNTTTCASTTVTVNTPSVAPTAITGSLICTGGSTTLSFSGGTVGSGAVAKWYTGSCGGTLAGTGNTLTVTPIAGTTYYVRYEGTCNTTTCVSATISTYTLPAVPTVSATTTQICTSGTTVFNANEMAPGGRVANFTNPAQPQSSSVGYTAAPNTFTMELWVNPTATRTSTVEMNGVNAINGTSSGQRYAIIPTHQSANGGAGISVGTNGVSVFEHGAGYMPSLLVWDGAVTGWTHIAVVYNAKTPSLYINGNFVKTGLTSQMPNVYPSSGTGTFYGSYLGGMDNIRIWNYARSQAQIQTDMHWENPSNPSGLIAHYTFDNNDYTASVGTNVTGSNASYANANYYTYTWTGGPALPAAATSEAQNSGTINTVGTHNYVVTAAAGGCISANSVPVVVTVDTPSTPPTSMSGGGTFCQGNNVTLAPVGGTLGSSATYEWYTGSCNGTWIGNRKYSHGEPNY